MQLVFKYGWWHTTATSHQLYELGVSRCHLAYRTGLTASGVQQPAASVRTDSTLCWAHCFPPQKVEAHLTCASHKCALTGIPQGLTKTDMNLRPVEPLL